ncbi:MAG: DUF3592 domain-containing protein [Clostridia bacterium]|nr:DUF3592 domain-containing protein [Clostridia bacterium]
MINGTINKIAKIRFFAGLIIVGIIFAVIGGYITVKQSEDWTAVTATIESVSSGINSDGERVYSAVISYTDADGTVHTISDWSVSSDARQGDGIEIEYNPANPDQVRSTGTGFISVIIFVVGIAIVVIGIIKAIGALKTPASEMNRFDRTSQSADNVTQSMIDEVADSTEERHDYLFHYTGKLNQSYILKTAEDKTPVYEAVCDKMAVIGASDYTFVNHVTCHRKQLKIGHTTETSYGNGNLSMITDSYFKIDGQICWDVLGNMGYSVEPYLEKFNIAVDVKKYGIKVAHFEQAGSNVVSEKQTKLGEVLKSPGIYKVNCRESDIEGVFLACFCFSRI